MAEDEVRKTDHLRIRFQSMWVSSRPDWRWLSLSITLYGSSEDPTSVDFPRFPSHFSLHRVSNLPPALSRSIPTLNSAVFSLISISKEMTTSDELDRFSHFSMTRLYRSQGCYELFACQWATAHPLFPQAAWLKLFSRESSPDGRFEVAFLSELTKNHGNLSIPKYVHHMVSAGRLYLFITSFDCTLSHEIKNRGKSKGFWAEKEVWIVAARLFGTLFRLHAMRIAHRSLDPNSIFLRSNEVYIGNFDDAKLVAKGQTERMATVRGCIGYLSPASFQALRDQHYQKNNYDSAFRDDVWGLGVTLLSMLVLRLVTDLSDHFTDSQSQFDAVIRRLIDRERYSERLITIVCWMMTLDEERRPRVEECLEVIREETRLGVCFGCRKEQYFTVDACDAGHIQCEECLVSRVKACVRSESQVATCECGAALRFAQSDRCMRVMDIVGWKKCPNCSIETHKAARRIDGEWKAYHCLCPCGSVFCSFCGKRSAHSGEHGEFKCPAFPEM